MRRAVGSPVLVGVFARLFGVDARVELQPDGLNVAVEGYT